MVLRLKSLAAISLWSLGALPIACVSLSGAGNDIIDLPWIFVTENWIEIVGSTAHRGDDVFAQDWRRKPGGETAGQAVCAAVSGVVAYTGQHEGFGLTAVLWEPERQLAVRYAHLDQIAVAPGQSVIAGVSIIGRVGSSGLRHPSMAHIHVAVYTAPDPRAERPLRWVDLAPVDSPFARRFRLVKSAQDCRGSQLVTVSAQISYRVSAVFTSGVDRVQQCAGRSMSHRGAEDGHVETRRLRHAVLGSSFGNRIGLNAALAKTNSHSTFAIPRSLTFRTPATVFSQPKAGSMRGRAC